MKAKPPLVSFFAVTMTSIYRVEYRPEENDSRVEKVSIILGAKSDIRVGTILGCSGQLVSIGRKIIKFSGRNISRTALNKRTSKRDIKYVPLRHRGSYTSPVVALFMSYKAARNCGRKIELQECDPRWVRFTKHVLKRIGTDHPVFCIAQSPRLRLVK